MGKILRQKELKREGMRGKIETYFRVFKGVSDYHVG